MGYLMVSVQLPDAASTERTRHVMEQIQRICLGTEKLNAARGVQQADGVPQVEPVKGIRHILTVAGTSMVLNVSGSYFGFMFVILDDYANRDEPGLSAEQIAAKLRKRCAEEVPDAMVTVLPPPPVRGVGRTGGFKLMIEDRGDLGLTTLQERTDAVAEAGRQSRWPRLSVAPNVFRANAPQLFVDMNRAQCMTTGVRLSDAFDTLQVFLGSLYVNDFNLFGRTWQVIVQADARARNDVEKVRLLKVRGSSGSMVPMGTVADVREVNGPLILTRYNMYPAAAIQGQPVPGVSSRQAIDLMEGVSEQELPPNMRYEWTELAYLELQAGSTAMMIFGFAVVMVFLVLAAQYESWSLPLAVILVVPICLLAAITGVTAVPAVLQWFHGLQHWVAGGAGPGAPPGAAADINIFTQIGFVVLVGLASKNAILIVEFARRQRAVGTPRREAAMAACKLRLRPIVMTSFAFILGVFPLLIGHGAGSEMRRTLGTAVFSGMLGVTLFGIFLTPVFFVVVDSLSGHRLFQSRAIRRLRHYTRYWIAFPFGFVRDLVRRRRRKRDDGKP
jgi:multidrug efflux pump